LGDEWIDLCPVSGLKQPAWPVQDKAEAIVRKAAAAGAQIILLQVGLCV
jgi:hypothetical protein